MSTLLSPFRIRFTNNSVNSAYDDYLLRLLFINTIIFITIPYSWRDCGPSLVWSSRFCSKISFKLLFAICRQFPSGLKMLKSTGEREYNIVFLKSTGFPVFTLYRFNAFKMFLFTAATLTPPSFLVIRIFGMT